MNPRFNSFGMKVYFLIDENLPLSNKRIILKRKRNRSLYFKLFSFSSVQFVRYFLNIACYEIENLRVDLRQGLIIFSILYIYYPI